VAFAIEPVIAATNSPKAAEELTTAMEEKLTLRRRHTQAKAVVADAAEEPRPPPQNSQEKASGVERTDPLRYATARLRATAQVSWMVGLPSGIALGRQPYIPARHSCIVH